MKPLTARMPELDGLSVLVVGLGRSGLAAVRLAASKGARILAVDARRDSDLADAVSRARALGATIRTGGHPPELADDADLVIVSPGVPSDTPVLAAARRRGVPVWGEVELAARFCEGRIVAVTGTNGKSTTTSMAGAILRAAGLPGGTGGNLGPPLCDLLSTDGPDAVHAVELSSFQLETIETLRPEAAVVLNLVPDHLDRYASFEHYAKAKARLLEAQDERGFAVLNADDPESRRWVAAVRGRRFEFSTREAVEHGAFLRTDGTMVLRTPAGEESFLDASKLRVPGEHNVANALAAALACRLVGCGVDAVARGLAGFRALPHRLEFVASVDGVEFYNDSKATNLDSAVRALEAFPGTKIHLILGGRDKGADWTSLAPRLRERARSVLLVGEAASTIRRALGGAVPLIDCGSVGEAVRAGYRGAAPGEVVLLAPGCASFDQYVNFEERGKDFRRAVESLLPEGTSDG